jgi:hypothetical protein
LLHARVADRTVTADCIRQAAALTNSMQGQTMISLLPFWLLGSPIVIALLSLVLMHRRGANDATSR